MEILNNNSKKNYMFMLPLYPDENDKTNYCVGYHIVKHNLLKKPFGQIKIINAYPSFNTKNKHGYSIDYILRICIKRWKKKYIIKNRHKMLRVLLNSNIFNKLPFDVIKFIAKNNYL